MTGNRMMLGIASVLLLVALCLALVRVVFLAKAEITIGEVTAIEAVDGRCGGGGKRRKTYACTKFSAEISFNVANQTYSIFVPAGLTSAARRSTAAPRHYVGQAIEVIYNPKKPGQAYRHTWLDVWSLPLMFFGGHLIALVGAIWGKRKPSTEGD